LSCKESVPVLYRIGYQSKLFLSAGDCVHLICHRSLLSLALVCVAQQHHTRKQGTRCNVLLKQLCFVLPFRCSSYSAGQHCRIQANYRSCGSALEQLASDILQLLLPSFPPFLLSTSAALLICSINPTVVLVSISHP